MKRLTVALRLSLLIVLLIPHSTAFAQRRIASKKRVSSDAQASLRGFELIPFDLEKEELPQHFLGHSLIAVYATLATRKRQEAKGEFEPTIDYHARMEKLRKRPLVGSVKEDDLLAFSFAPDDYQLKLRYDADLSVMDVMLEWMSVGYRFGAHIALDYSTTRQMTRSFIGRNAFNRAVRVHVIEIESYRLGTDPKHLYKFAGGAKVATSIPMSPTAGRRAKSTMRALVVCRLASYPAMHDSSVTTAKIDDPYERHQKTYIVNVIPEEVWFYDIETGEVYLREKAKNR